jgi:RNA polymerase sigma-70 factor (ECF subfamily)
MSERPDEELVARWAAGDLDAFEALYDRYRRPLYRYLLRLAGDEASANDWYQGAWEKVIRARKSYKPKGPFRAWLYRIAHNHAMDQFRRNRPETELDNVTLVSEETEPAEALDHLERERSLREAVQALPEKQREALLLKLDAGLALDEIAAVTGVNRETAKSRLRYAVARLKTVLKEPVE